jgi:putative glycosyltransferase (TIGR04348 family)
MRLLLVTPAPPASHHGNRVTAERWRDQLVDLGHEVEVAEEFTDQDAEVLIALHARRSAAAVRRFRSARPDAKVVLALTGTDLYPDLATSGVERAVLEAADRLVVLQPLGVEQLPDDLRCRSRVIVQSATVVPGPPPPVDRWKVALLAHLRPVKDPLLAAAAVRQLPASSRTQVEHLGAALDPQLGEAAAAETETNPRYHWLGDRPHHEALRTLTGSHLLLVTSRHEGGANAVSEALAAQVPVVSTRIPGSVGLLGPDYPGYVPVGDATALAALLRALESDEGSRYTELCARCRELTPRFHPAREREAWAALVGELCGMVATSSHSGPGGG